MKIAVVHDWLISRGGAENTLAQILRLFPSADLFSLLDFIPEGERGFLLDKKTTTSFLQKLPFAQRKYRNYLPLLPFAARRFDLSSYDLVISSSHAAAKGVVTRPGQLHICYCYTPFRYAWDLREQYLGETGLGRGVKGFAVRAGLSLLRDWDVANSRDVDHFVTLSEYVRDRIKRAYNREAEVIYPPVDTELFTLNEKKENFYVTVSRLVPYKKTGLLVKAFSGMPGRRLVVVGQGPDLEKIKKAAGPNVEFRTQLDKKALALCLQKARAFVFAAEEDFGIAPLEAQACGTPVIAYGKGGLLETVRGKFADERITGAEPMTGIFFRDQAEACIIDAVRKFETLKFDPAACRANSLRFSEENFRSRFKAFVEEKLALL
ncbi:MAG: glycosyltransferase [Elusimicrobia bacterium]|nr:glycosyltransferase [Elusimicrobiota bacterium]